MPSSAGSGIFNGDAGGRKAAGVVAISPEGGDFPCSAYSRRSAFRCCFNTVSGFRFRRRFNDDATVFHQHDLRRRVGAYTVILT